MKPVNKIKGQTVRIVLIVLVNLVGIYSCTVEAQSFKKPKYLGFEVGFGMRSFKVSSSIEKINQMQADHEGGSLGLVFGNELLRTRVSLAGVYYSNANTPHVQQLFETSAITNFYPLEAIQSLKWIRLQPYLTTGFGMTNTRFYGTYLENQNLSSGYEPLLGKVSLLNAKGGIGLEYYLKNDFDFVHLFVEALYGAPVLSGASNRAFSNTEIKRFVSLSFGVSFGVHR